MLTGADETDLLLPLFDGAMRRARFGAFLNRLLRRTRADHAALLLPDESFVAGTPMPALGDQIRAAGLRAGRVYALAELPAAGAASGDARILCLPGDEPAWLVIASAGECRAADAALLSALGAYVALAVGQYRAEQHHAARHRAAAATLDRAGAGWVLLDADGRVIDADPALAQHCEAAGLRVRRGERLVPASVAAASAAGESCAHVLHTAPLIEAVLVPANQPGAATLALCRVARRTEPAPHRQFAQLAGLPPREAEFAVALARGATIAEAGAALGLTLETARNYSKQVYAKLGLRGQAELVRRFYESGASLA
jgi:DNA-binding NarL/FixJ family response regulator